ncbi:protein FAM102B-like isoform X2 [Clupea harengus]|uniref:Protein FAM102B-like isoform X2 n=1 Tax=Clupea harengus TaxID=7950 RepID=A0A8M1KN00_CLUHA|nr:protein FAM102B-like isoform X2 [Clupea harengus]
MDHGRWASALLQAHVFVRKRLCTHSFSVSLFLDELANVPQVTGWLFCKVRLLDGSFVEETESCEVFRNTVQWRKEFVFECGATVNGSTGVLSNSICRVSVREDRKGGRSYKKVGYIDLNLVEFIGSGYVTRHCLLEGYMGKHSKLDNSLLKVRLQVQLLQGDPCFRTPVQATDPTSTMATVSGTSASPLECPSKPVPVKILRDLTETSSRSMEKVLGQNLEEQERALVAEHLTRLDHTRVDAWDVVENLCLEQLGSQLELSTPMEGTQRMEWITSSL